MDTQDHVESSSEASCPRGIQVVSVVYRVFSFLFIFFAVATLGFMRDGLTASRAIEIISVFIVGSYAYSLSSVWIRKMDKRGFFLGIVTSAATILINVAMKIKAYYEANPICSPCLIFALVQLIVTIYLLLPKTRERFFSAAPLLQG